MCRTLCSGAAGAAQEQPVYPRPIPLKVTTLCRTRRLPGMKYCACMETTVLMEAHAEPLSCTPENASGLLICSGLKAS